MSVRRTSSVILLVVAVIPTSLAQGPVLDAATPLSGAQESGEAGGTQRAPYIAEGGLGALAVWLDYRAEFSVPLVGTGGLDVFAMRVDAAGQPLDPAAIRLPAEVGDKKNIRAAWNGSAWLVTWENQDPLAFSSFFRHINGVRVAGDGTLLDNAPIVIKDDSATTGGTTAIGSDGNDWFVIAQGVPANGARVVAIRVAADGTVVNPGGTKLIDLSFAMGSADLAFANGLFLLTYADSPVHALRFTPALVTLGQPITVGTGSVSRPRVASDGQDFLVTWQNAGFGMSVRARRVTPSGALSPEIVVTPSVGFVYNEVPDVAWSGGHWHIAFRDSDDDAYRVARITPSLTLLDFDGVPLPIGAAKTDAVPAVAGSTGGVMLAFEGVDLAEPFPGAIRSTFVDDTLTTTPPADLSLSAARQGAPAIAAGEGQYLAVFTSEEHGTQTIAMQRLDAFGGAVDAEPIAIATGSRLGRPAVAWNGAVYLVVFEDRVSLLSEIDDVTFATRVTSDGVLLDAQPFPVLDASEPAVAAAGSTFLVVGSEASTSEIRRPVARRVASDGTSLDASQFPLGGSFSRYPAVGGLADRWVVSWQRQFSHDNPNSVVNAALVMADGSIASSFLVDGAAGFGGASRPAVAARGDLALIAWNDDGLGISARRVLAAGTVLPAFQVTPPPAVPSMPAAVWNGEEFTVAWHDFRNQVGIWDKHLDVYAARVAVDGVLLDVGGGFPVAQGIETAFDPAVAGAHGATLIAYDQFLPEPPYATLRVVTRRESPWQSAGGAVGGPMGPPLLLGQGDLELGQQITFQLSGAAPLTSGVFIIGLSPVSVPFFGGLLVPSPQLVLPIGVNAAGVFAASFPLQTALPPASTVYLQVWTSDPSAPFGVAGSNAITAVAP